MSVVARQVPGVSDVPAPPEIPTTPAPTPTETPPEDTPPPATPSPEPTAPDPTTDVEPPTSSEETTPTPTTSSSTSTSEEPETTSTPTTSSETTESTSTSTSTSTSSSSSSSETTSSSSSESSESSTTVTITSTELSSTSDSLSTATTDSPSFTSSTSSLPSSTSEAQGGGGLSAGGTIAVAVVVPVVSVALIIIGLIFLWRKRKARKLAEEERKQEIEEYQFNPNNDPSLPAVGLPGNYDDGSGHDGNSGYRGWGTTSSHPRKLSTNLSSGAGMTVSDGGTYGRVSPIDDNMRQLVDDDNRPVSGRSETIGDLPTVVPLSASNRADIRRGPSNASSAYSVGNHSDVSDEMAPPGVSRSSQYYDDGAYYTQQQGPYGDMSYGGPPPVIRDVQARRNTRIETPSVFPQHGNAGISQNF